LDTGICVFLVLLKQSAHRNRTIAKTIIVVAFRASIADRVCPRLFPQGRANAINRNIHDPRVAGGATLHAGL